MGGLEGSARRRASGLRFLVGWPRHGIIAADHLSNRGDGRVPMDMEYRRLGRSGLKVSVLSFGSWVTFGPQLDVGLAVDCIAAAREAGVNFFDNAEAYSGGESERIMGKAFERLGWKRNDYVVSTKVFWGLDDGPTCGTP